MLRNEIPYLLIRISYGAILLSHGLLLKVFDYTIDGTVEYFSTSYGIPAIVTYLIIFGETVGGAAILIGLYTRLAALLSLPIVLGALYVHLSQGWLFSNTGGGYEFPLLLLVLGVACTVKGNGIISIKRLPIIDLLVPDIFK